MMKIVIYAGVYAALFSGMSLIVSTIFFWKEIHWQQKLIRLSIACMVLYPSILRIVYYAMGGAIPRSMGIIQNLLYTTTCVLLIVFVGNNRIKDKI